MRKKFVSEKSNIYKTGFHFNNGGKFNVMSYSKYKLYFISDLCLSVVYL